MKKEEAFAILMDYIKGSGCLVFKATGLPNEIMGVNSMLSEIPKYSNVAKFSKVWIGKKLSFTLVEIDTVETLEIVLDTWTSSIPELREVVVLNNKKELDTLIDLCDEGYLYLKLLDDIKLVVKNINQDESHDIYEVEYL